MTMRVIDEGGAPPNQWRLVECGRRYILQQRFIAPGGVPAWAERELDTSEVWGRYPAEQPSSMQWREQPRRRPWWARVLGGRR